MRRPDWLPLFDAVLGAAVAVLFCVAFSAHADPHAATLSLEFNDGWCSGTAVGQHTILTATHCIVDGAVLETVNGLPAREVSAVSDGIDHTLLQVDMVMPVVATVDTAGLHQGTHVHFWGNPEGVLDVYREGYIGGFCFVPQQCLRNLVHAVTGVTFGGPAWEVIAPGAEGDSGTGVFDENDRLIGVISATMPLGDYMSPMIVFPMAFTPQQWSTIR